MALLLLLLAATTAKADDCATTPPTKPQKEVEAYLRALYPGTTRVDDAVAAFERLDYLYACLLYTSPSPRDATLSRMPSSA